MSMAISLRQRTPGGGWLVVTRARRLFFWGCGLSKLQVKQASVHVAGNLYLWSRFYEDLRSIHAPCVASPLFYRPVWTLHCTHNSCEMRHSIGFSTQSICFHFGFQEVWGSVPEVEHPWGWRHLPRDKMPQAMHLQGLQVWSHVPNQRFQDSKCFIQK